MQRNKLVYALADASLVVSSDFNKGGTWTGATEQLEKLRFVPVFVRSPSRGSEGLEALERKGALPWPNPHGVEALDAVFDAAASVVPPTESSSRTCLNESRCTIESQPGRSAHSPSRWLDA
jgi:predicted Rossmann fold nucleotide-binding protein DprA/Smf involved in DNA uptake